MACRYEPRYDVTVPSHHFVTERRDYMEVARRHSRLYIVPDFAKFVCCWPQVGAWPSLCLQSTLHALVELSWQHRKLLLARPV